MAKQQRKMSKTALNTLYNSVAEGLATLHERSEKDGDKGHARVLMLALAGYMAQRGILDDLNLAAMCITKAAFLMLSEEADHIMLADE